MGAGISQALRDVGNKLGAHELQSIAASLGVSVERVASKASDLGIKVKPAAQQVVAASAPASAPASSAPSASSAPASAPASTPSSYGGGGGGGTSVSLPEFNAAQTAAELQTRSNISNYGWDAQKAMENIRQAAETERLKYEVDNRIPVVQAEAQGKIDLQKIVNAGLENVTRIERGADMMRSITSMFNF